MKFFIVLTVCLAAVVAAPSEREAQVLRNDVDNIGIGEYSAISETSNGISSQSRGVIKDVRVDDVVVPALVVEGQYSYPGPDGVVYTVRYIADENGYRAVGDHIPA